MTTHKIAIQLPLAARDDLDEEELKKLGARVVPFTDAETRQPSCLIRYKAKSLKMLVDRAAKILQLLRSQSVEG